MGCQPTSDPVIRLYPRAPGTAAATSIDPDIRLHPGTEIIPHRPGLERSVLRAMRRSLAGSHRLEVLPKLRVTKELDPINAVNPTIFLWIFTP